MHQLGNSLEKWVTSENSFVVPAHYLQHGDIFDVRWPSKKYKSTRRFCYVQYTSPVRSSHMVNGR